MKKQARKTAAPNLQLVWFGHSAFSITSPGGKNILIDPWLENPKAPPEAKELSKVDLILVTHGHSDHVGNTVELSKRFGAKVLAIYEVYAYLQSHGVTTAQGMNKGGTVDVLGMKVTMVDAKHSSGIDSNGSMSPGGEAAAFVVEFENGFTLYHAGDTTVFSDMKLIGELYRPQAALLPIGGLYTMGPREAALACKLLNPRFIIGMHYGTFPMLTGTPAELRKYLPATLKSRVIELQPGKAVTL